tara:strand:- start:128 stop:559 length:432 start_codon:yes stop_codon:yes gene_type:complete
MKVSAKLLEEFKEALASEGLRFTEQRLVVLEDILASNAHRDCNQIHESLINRGHKVSIATIYRTLDVLLDYGFIRKLDIGDGSVKYERKIGSPHHDHMICIETGKIIEFVDSRIEKIQDKIAQEKGYEIVKHVHQLFVKPIKK